MAPGKPVVIITWVGQKPELSSILLTSHMDVVPVYSVSNIFFVFVYIEQGWQTFLYESNKNYDCFIFLRFFLCDR